MSCFPLTVFKIFSFNTLTMMCWNTRESLCLYYFECIEYLVQQINVPYQIFSHYFFKCFFLPLTLSPTSFGAPIVHMLAFAQVWIHACFWDYVFHHSFYSLFFRLGNFHLSTFKPTNYFFQHFNTVMSPSHEFFISVFYFCEIKNFHLVILYRFPLCCDFLLTESMSSTGLTSNMVSFSSCNNCFEGSKFKIWNHSETVFMNCFPLLCLIIFLLKLGVLDIYCSSSELWLPPWELLLLLFYLLNNLPRLNLWSLFTP